MNKIQERFDTIRSTLKEKGDPAIVVKYSRYFREGYDAYGLDQKTFENLRAEWVDEWKVDFSFSDFLELGEKLMATGKYEEASCAIVFAEAFKEEYTLAHLEIFGEWLEKYVANWAHTDIMCGRLLPHFLKEHIVKPEWFTNWILSQSKWQRRAIPVTFLSILKDVESIRDLFSIIDPLMNDKEDMVQKGLGWFLRESWKLYPEVSEEFLLLWKDVCGRIIVQYATEKMDKEYRIQFRKERKK